MKNFTVVFGLFAAAMSAQTADEIMQRVAENQTRARDQRNQYVYHQNILVRVKRPNGKVAREETHDFTVTPTAKGLQKQRVSFSGKYEKSGKMIDYSKPGYKYKEVDIDGELVEDMVNDFANDEKSRDGIDHDMFPLRTEELKKYDFKLAGRDNYRGHEVYQITFKPSTGRDIDDSCWAGEALIDTQEFEPVMVTTHLACKIPILVKTLLGTDIKQVGAKITYEKFGDGLWFPVTYGGELKFRAVFLYARSMAIGVINSDFKRASVETKIAFDEPKKPEPPSQP